MRDNEAVVMSAANLDIIERNLGALAQNIGQVSTNMEHVNTKVNSVTESVKTIEDEIKKFMLEIRGNTVVANARQTIMMDQDELNKKYGHYDNIRRKVNGLFQASDINAIKKTTVENLSQEVMVNTPDYWLAPALVAICAWFNNNKELADSALKEAIRRDDEKTSLLFCFIHLRAKRVSGAKKWLTRYLQMQDPTKMELKIITVLDAITNGAFGIDANQECINTIVSWMQELDRQPGYKDAQINLWEKYFANQVTDHGSAEYSYILTNVENASEVLNHLNAVQSSKNMFSELKSIINSKNDNGLDYTTQIDKIINNLVFNYENDELDLKRDIDKNRLIIEQNGDVNKANEIFSEEESLFSKTMDFYSIITQIIQNNSILKPSDNTRKLALSLAKSWIVTAAKKQLVESSQVVKIAIDNWHGTTVDGSNEKELLDNIKETISGNYLNKYQTKPLLDFKSIATFSAGIILGVISFFLKWSIVGWLILLITLGLTIYLVYNNSLERNIITKEYEKELKDNEILLKCILAEIVDINFIKVDSKLFEDSFINYLNALDYNSYIQTTESRNIDTGGLNG